MPPRRHPLAVPALVLAIVASGGTLLALIFRYLQTTPIDYLSAWEEVLANVVRVMYLSAPLLGITSLIMAYVASGRIKRSSGQLTGGGIVAAAKWIAWLGPLLWIITLIALLLADLSAGFRDFAPTGRSMGAMMTLSPCTPRPRRPKG